MKTCSLARALVVAAPLAFTVACGGGGSSGACTPSKTPEVLAKDPGFECGGTDWSALAGTLALVSDAHTGTHAAQVTADGLGARLAPRVAVVTNGGPHTFCFTAWVKGTVPYVKLRALRNDNLGGFQEFDFSAPITSTWTRLPPDLVLSVQNQSAPSIELAIEAQTGRSDGANAQAGQVLLVDDVDVWQSTSGTCDEVR
jgi:hypothetical protein